MNYRNVFIEFLYEYREYCPNNVQLIVLENNKTNDLINHFYELEEVHVFNAKGLQVFYKKRCFADIENTLVELAMINDLPQVYSLSEINYLSDIYTKESLEKNASQFVFVKPIIENMSMKAVLIVYSDIKIEWMITDKKLVKLCDLLQLELSNSLYDDISTNADSEIWLLEGNGYYLSTKLKTILNKDLINSFEELNGYGLRLISTKKYFNNNLLSFEVNIVPKVQSIFELYNLSISNYILIFLESNESEWFDGLYERIFNTFKKIDGKLGKYSLFQFDNEHMIVLFEEVLTKKSIEEHFDNYKYILVRSGNELKTKVDFKMLIEYLNISPIEDFNVQYYNYICGKYYIEKVKTVVQKISTSKIKIIPIFDSLNSSKKGYLIKDIGDINLFDKNTKQKSLLSLLKIGNEYKDDKIYLEIPLSYLFEGQKLSLSILNKLHKFVDENKDRCSVITNYSNLLLKIYAHWPEFNKYLYFYDIPNNLYQSILSLKDSNGLFISSSEYREFFSTNNIIASKFIKFILQDSKKILVKVKSTDIIKYQEENLLLVCE